MASWTPVFSEPDSRTEIEIHLAKLEQSLARVDRDGRYPEVVRELRAVIEEVKANLPAS